jgi:hypothetical protein
MSWLKLTSEALYLMKGGTNFFLDKIDLVEHNKDKEEFALDVPRKWFQGNDVPRTMLIDVGSTESPIPAPTSSRFDSNEVFSEVIKCADWGADAPISRFEIVDRPKYIVIHHTDHTNSPSAGKLTGAKKLAKDIQAFHMGSERGWSDIGYNFLNTVGGFLLEGRSGSLEEAIKGSSVRGAHAGTDNGNRSLGVANEGNFSVNKLMPPEQWKSLVDICAALCESCDIDPANIKGHCDFVPTTCPGEWLYNQLPQLRLEVAKHLSD